MLNKVSQQNNTSAGDDSGAILQTPDISLLPPLPKGNKQDCLTGVKFPIVTLSCKPLEFWWAKEIISEWTKSRGG